MTVFIIWIQLQLNVGDGWPGSRCVELVQSSPPRVRIWAASYLTSEWPIPMSHSPCLWARSYGTHTACDLTATAQNQTIMASSCQDHPRLFDVSTGLIPKGGLQLTWGSQQVPDLQGAAGSQFPFFTYTLGTSGAWTCFWNCTLGVLKG